MTGYVTAEAMTDEEIERQISFHRKRKAEAWSLYTDARKRLEDLRTERQRRREKP